MRLIQRDILPDVLKWIDKPEIIVILGSRQVGKTTLLKMILNEISDRPQRYFDLEDLDILQICNKGPKSFVEYLKLQGFSENSNSRVYVALDEIQYLDNPTNFLKMIHDHYPWIKLLVSGSSTLEIRQKFRDSLVGRKVVFELDSFSWNEFLKAKSPELFLKRTRFPLETLLVENSLPELNLLNTEFESLFNEYLMYGGYPRQVLETDPEIREDLIKEIYNTYVRRDVRDIGRIENVVAFNNLLKLIATQIAGLLNINELSNTLNINYKLALNYLFILENTFIIKLLHPYFKNKRKEISRMPKVFIMDLGLRNAILGNFQWSAEEKDFSVLVENFIFLELKRRYPVNEQLFYWRTLAKAEVDFVVKHPQLGMIPVEVKASALRKPRLSRSFRSFIATYNPRVAIVFNLHLTAVESLQNTRLYFLPVYWV